jgi:hypothetical protein
MSECMVSTASDPQLSKKDTYRVQFLQSLGDVDTETVLAALVGGREDTDKIEVESTVGSALDNRQ